MECFGKVINSLFELCRDKLFWWRAVAWRVEVGVKVVIFETGVGTFVEEIFSHSIDGFVDEGACGIAGSWAEFETKTQERSKVKGRVDINMSGEIVSGKVVGALEIGPGR